MYISKIYEMWRNDGTANLTLTKGSVNVLVPGSTLPANDKNYIVGSTITANNNILSSFWWNLPLLGADYLVLQYTSKLVDVTAITGNITANTLSLACQGMMATGPFPHDKPHAVQQASIPPSGNHGEPNYSSAMLQTDAHCNHVAPGLWSATSMAGTTHGSCALFLLANSAGRAPVSGTDFPGWTACIHARAAHNTNAGGSGTTPGFNPLSKISGYDAAWIAVTTFQDWSLPAANVNVKIDGRLAAILLTDTPRSIR